MFHIDQLPADLQTYWYIAIPVSLIFLVQTILTFIGADTSDGISADFDGDLATGESPFQLFSLRNLTNFLLGFSWTGISLYSIIENRLLLAIISFIVGLFFVLLFFVIIKQLRKLSENNSFRITETINKTAEVYLSIPEKKSGKGKVLVSVRGSIHELDAITEGDMIPSGAIVKITAIDNNLLLVCQL